jgi:hypothetical protein
MSTPILGRSTRMTAALFVAGGSSVIRGTACGLITIVETIEAMMTEG